jgi:hypothetical protein
MQTRRTLLQTGFALLALTLGVSSGVVLADDELTGAGSNGHPVDPTVPRPFQPRPAEQDTGGPGRLAPPNGKIPNGTPYGPGSGPRPVIGN